MNTLFRSLVVASLIVLAGSIFIATQVSSAKSDYSRASRSDEDPWAVQDRMDERIGNLHLLAKIPSVIYFGAAMAAFFVAARNPGLSNGWRLTLRITSAICLGMAVWSLALSGHLGMDEVVPAWVVATLLIGFLSFKLMSRGNTPQAAAGMPAA